MSRPPPFTALAGLACACLAAGARADPADYVFVPYATPSVRVVAYGAGAERGRDGGRETQRTLSLGWAPAGRWFSSLYAAWAAQDGGGIAFDEWSWLNHVQLNAPGSGPADLGLLCQLERPRDRDEGTGIACGPTLQADTDRLQVNFNALLHKHVGAAEAERTALGYQWQVKGLVRPGLELGAQGFGDFGPWNHWSPASRQEHTVGPAVFGKWPLGGAHALELEAGLLFGLGAGSPRDVLRLRAQQEF